MIKLDEQIWGCPRKGNAVFIHSETDMGVNVANNLYFRILGLWSDATYIYKNVVVGKTPCVLNALIT